MTRKKLLKRFFWIIGIFLLLLVLAVTAVTSIFEEPVGRRVLSEVNKQLTTELSVEDFERILTEPDASLTSQYQALLETEEVSLDFAESGVQRIAEVAYHVNENTENIGARRMHTVMERLIETISFEASDKSGTKLLIDAGYVDDHLAELSRNEDLSRYIL